MRSFSFALRQAGQKWNVSHSHCARSARYEIYFICTAPSWRGLKYFSSAVRHASQTWIIFHSHCGRLDRNENFFIWPIHWLTNWAGLTVRRADHQRCRRTQSFEPTLKPQFLGKRAEEPMFWKSGAWKTFISQRPTNVFEAWSLGILHFLNENLCFWSLEFGKLTFSKGEPMCRKPGAWNIFIFFWKTNVSGAWSLGSLHFLKQQRCFWSRELGKPSSSKENIMFLKPIRSWDFADDLEWMSTDVVLFVASCHVSPRNNQENCILKPCSSCESSNTLTGQCVGWLTRRTWFQNAVSLVVARRYVTACD